jgi:hypothetical protein
MEAYESFDIAADSRTHFEMQEVITDTRTNTVGPSVAATQRSIYVTAGGGGTHHIILEDFIARQVLPVELIRWDKEKSLTETWLEVSVKRFIRLPEYLIVECNLRCVERLPSNLPNLHSFAVPLQSYCCC